MGNLITRTIFYLIRKAHRRGAQIGDRHEAHRLVEGGLGGGLGHPPGVEQPPRLERASRLRYYHIGSITGSYDRFCPANWSRIRCIFWPVFGFNLATGHFVNGRGEAVQGVVVRPLFALTDRSAFPGDEAVGLQPVEVALDRSVALGGIFLDGLDGRKALPGGGIVILVPGAFGQGHEHELAAGVLDGSLEGPAGRLPAHQRASRVCLHAVPMLTSNWAAISWSFSPFLRAVISELICSGDRKTPPHRSGTPNSRFHAVRVPSEISNLLQTSACRRPRL